MLAHEGQRKGGAIVDNDFSVAIKNFPARRDQGDGPNLVLLGKLLVIDALENLEVPDSRQ